jgi:hypothetical protein
MPNGGSDCCGTCWFNRKNKGEGGYSHSEDPDEDFCIIRDVAIENPFWTYCSNHPYRFPDRESIPIGPVYAHMVSGRQVWQQSPDTQAIRNRLLELLEAIDEEPVVEYPSGVPTDEVIVWQLGEFREKRAIHGLRRILGFNPSASSGGPTVRTRESLIQAARDAISKIGN